MSDDNSKNLESFSRFEPIIFMAVLIIGIVSALFFLVTKTAVKDERTPDGRIIVNYWEKWTGFERDALVAVIDDFNKSQNKIFVKLLTVSTIDQKLLLATAGGTPPDIAGVWVQNVNVFAEKGALTPLNKMLEKKGISRKDYIPVFWDLCERKGFMWALPSTPATVALHWNKRLFRDAGLDPDKPPKSRAELDEMNEKLTIVSLKRGSEVVKVRYCELTDEEKKQKNFDIVQLGYTPTEPGWWNSMWCYWFDGELWDGERKITADSKEGIEALKWFKSFGEKYGIQNLRNFGASFGNFSSPQNPFLSEKVAMVLQGVWMFNFIEKYAPQVEWAAAPFPSLGENPKNPFVSIAECDVLVIPKGARHAKEAFEFMSYVNSRGPMEKLNMGQRKFSPLAEVSPDFVKDHPNKYIQVFIDLAKSPGVRTIPKMPVWNEYNTELSVAYDQAFTDVLSPEEALKNARERTQWKLDKILKRWDMIKDDRMKEWKQENDAW